MLRLSTLGSLGLECLDGEGGAKILSQPKRFAILVYLAVARPWGFHRRDTLLTLLWPESNEARARNALSQSLSFLRRNLVGGTLVSRGTDEIGVEGTAINADAVEFQTALDEGRWAEALDLYRGDFLRGFHVSGAPGFEGWMQGERDRLRDAAADAAWALARDQLRRGALGIGERTAKRAIGLVCPDQTTVRRFMEMLVAAGDRVAALRIYQLFSEVLHGELGIEPTSDLADLAAGLRSVENEDLTKTRSGGVPSDLPHLGPGTWTARPPTADGLTVAGRDLQLTRLGRYLDQALTGKGGVAFISGEAGTGKTVLAREFAVRSLDAFPDLVCATGYCDAHTGRGDPYHPFREILSLLTGDLESPWMAGSVSTHLARRLGVLFPIATEAILELGPDLLDTCVSPQPLVSRASELGPEGAQWAARLNLTVRERVEGPSRARPAAIIDQYSRVLKRLSRAFPLLLFLEDLQWADADSLDLLFHLGRHLEGTRILLLGLFRPSEVFLDRGDERHPLVKVLNEFKASFGDIEIELDRVDDWAFMEALVDSEPNALDEDFREALFQKTRGHALFTIEFLRELQDQGRLRPDRSGRWVAGPDLVWDLLPARIEAVLVERTSRLPKALREILTVASVEGEQFTLEIVARVLGRDPVDLIALVSDGLVRRHRLVQIEGVHRLGDHRLSGFRFRHNLFQEFLYEQLDGAERAYLHEQVGRAIKEVYGDHTHHRALVLARHFREAGLGEEAVRQLQAAGEWAQKRGGYREALELYKTASDLVLGLPELPGRERLELEVLSGMGMTSWAMGLSVMDQEEILHRVRELAEALKDENRMFWALGRTFTKHHYLGEQEKARQILDEVASLVDRSGDPGQRLQLQAWRSFSAVQRGFPRQALSLLDQVESGYDPVLYQALLSIWVEEPLPIFRSLRALALAPLGYPEQAARAVQEAYALLESRPDPACLLYVRLHDVLRGWLCRDLTELAPPGHDSEREGALMGSGGWSAISRFTAGLALTAEGNPHKAVAEMKEAIGDLDTLGWGAWRPFLSAQLASVLGRIGATDEGLRLVDQSLNRIEETGERFQESEVHRIRGELLLSLPTPDPSGAETAYRRANTIARDQEARLYELRALVSLARLLREQGRSKEAQKMLRECYGWFTEGFDFPDLKEAGLLLSEWG